MWPKSSESSSVSAIAPQLTATNGLRRPPAVRVDRTRDQFLPGTALALDQHRDCRICGPRYLLIDLEHRRAAAEQPFRRDPRFRRRQRVAVHRLRQRALDRGLDLADVERLADVVESARAQRLDRRLERAEPADQHNLTRGLVRLELAQEIQPRGPRVQVDVRHDQIERPPRHEGHGSGRIVRRQDLAIRLRQQLRHERARLAVVVDDQNVGHGLLRVYRR